jgi:predicted nucleic acid-binding protein
VAYYVDTSAFLKLVVEEAHSAAFRSWAEDHDGELFSSDLLHTESLRAARRHSTDALREARRRLEVVALVRMTPDVCERAAELDPAILRSLDALHLAAALSLADELEGVVTYDDRLAEACTLYGVEVIEIQDADS